MSQNPRLPYKGVGSLKPLKALIWSVSDERRLIRLFQALVRIALEICKMVDNKISISKLSK